MNKIIDIQVRPLFGAKRFTSDLPWAAISVTTYPEEFPELSQDNRIGLLQLDFWDICTCPDDLEYKVKLFNTEQAQRILDFVAECLPKIECLLIHCEAGVSRSPAIAAALCHILYGKETEKIYFREYIPNTHVYNTILETHRVKPIF